MNQDNPDNPGTTKRQETWEEIIKGSLVWWALGLAVTAFGVGWLAHKTVLETGRYTTINQKELDDLKARANTPVPTPCRSLNGTWQVDGKQSQYHFDQNGCRSTGYLTNSELGFTTLIVAMADGQSAVGYSIVTTNANCVVYFGDEYTQISDSRYTLTEKIPKQCGFDGHPVTSNFTKVAQ